MTFATIGILFIGIWLGSMISHAITASMNEPVCRRVPDDCRDPLERLCWLAFFRVCDGMRDRQPTAWGVRRPFMRTEPRGCRDIKHGMQTRHGVVDLFDRDVDIDTREIMAGDPMGKFEAAAEDILLGLRDCRIRSFAEMPMIDGLSLCMLMWDPQTGVRMRVVRGFDIMENRFITWLQVLAEVADRKC